MKPELEVCVEQFKQKRDKLSAIVDKFLSSIQYLDFEIKIQQENWKDVFEYLQLAWEAAPDELWIHAIPGWSTLCDICSEHCFGELYN